MGIHRRQGVIQHQDRRRQQQGAGDGEALLLAAGEGHPLLPHLGLIASGETNYVVVDAGDARHPLYLLLACLRLAEGDVGGDGGGEEEGLLGHIGKLVAQGAQG
ncbi:hypothetical protein D3C85_545850 [compost metagenome]